MSKAIDTLRQLGVSVTKPRIVILEYLMSEPMHVSASSLCNDLKDTLRISRATVYNTLNIFTENKLLKKIFVNNGTCYFDTNLSQHYHIYDVDKKELIDVCITDNSNISNYLESMVIGSSDVKDAEIIASDVILYTKSRVNDCTTPASTS